MTVNSLGAQELSYLSGLSATQGYQVLNKTIKQAVTNFEKTPTAQSDITYFETNVAKAKSVNDFLGNTRLVDFVLSAFGLDQEAGYQGLIKQVLTQDPNSSKSLVNQLTDPRFKQMATALDFYDDGLGKLQAVGLTAPKTATTAEGVSLTSTTSATASSTQIGVGIGIQDNEYLVLQKPDGTSAYAKSGYFTLNSDSQLQTSDGTLLKPSIVFPSDTTAITVTATGVVYAQEKGSTSPTNVGILEIAKFSSPTNLAKDKNGYLTPTTKSGSATLDSLTGKAYTFTNTNQDLVNQYVQNEFETAVGSANTAVREALYFQRTIGTDEQSLTSSSTTALHADVILGDSVLSDVARTILDQPAQIAYEQLSRQEQIVENGLDLKKLSSSSSTSYVASLTARYLSEYDAANAASTNAANSPALQILNAFNSSSSSSSSSGSILSLFT